MSNVPGTPSQTQDQGLTQTPAASQEQANAPAAGTQPEQSVGKGATLDDLQALEKKLRGEMQRTVSKEGSQIGRRLADLEKSLSTLKAAGKEIPPEEANALRARVFTDAMTAEASPEGTENQPAQAGSQLPSADPVTQIALLKQQKAGILLYDSDPEVKLIKVDGSPLDYLDSIDAALEAKKKRVASGQQQTSSAEAAAQTATPPAARMAVSGSLPAVNLSPEDKIAKGLQQSFDRLNKPAK